MTNLEIGLWSFPLLLLLIFLRLPIGLAMLLCGLGGSWIVFGNVTPVLAKLKNEGIPVLWRPLHEATTPTATLSASV